MYRRTFLGVAATAAAAPSSETEGVERTRADIETGDYGTRRATFPKHEGVQSFADVSVPDDGEASIGVNGFAYDEGDDPHVDVHFQTTHVRLMASVSPDRARSIAADLLEAADEAETPVDAE